MKKYNIIAETESYIANRDSMFNGKTSVILERGLSLKESQDKLLDMYNHYYEGERPYACNWGMAVIHSRKKIYGANDTYRDGTRFFDYDGRRFKIKETCEYYITFKDNPSGTEVFISDNDYDCYVYPVSHDSDDAIAYEDEDGIIDKNAIKEWARNIADNIREDMGEDFSDENYNTIVEKFESILDKFRNDL